MTPKIHLRSLYWVDVCTSTVIKNSPSLEWKHTYGKVLIQARSLKHALTVARNKYSWSELQTIYTY